jgi:hypothetical protein
MYYFTGIVQIQQFRYTHHAKQITVLKVDIVLEHPGALVYHLIHIIQSSI